MDMQLIEQLLPLYIPFALCEMGLLAYTIVHIATHRTYKHGNRVLWLIVSIVGMQLIGPILYFLLGREE